MASNSFALKGWAVGIASAVLVVDLTSSTRLVGLIALVPLVAFWWLDAYFLLQERLYRALYDDIARELRGGARDLVRPFDLAAWPGGQPCLRRPESGGHAGARRSTGSGGPSSRDRAFGVEAGTAGRRLEP